MRITSFGWSFILVLISPLMASAHPMDLASLAITPVDDRLRVVFRVHELAVARILKIDPSTLPKSKPADLAFSLLAATLEEIAPKVDRKACFWSRPELSPAPDDRTYWELKVAAICSTSRFDPFYLQLDLPFLKNAPREFQVLVKVDGLADAGTPVVLNSTRTTVELGDHAAVGIGGFVLMGMAHIGVAAEEWRGKDGRFQLAEGIDHICFLLALILASASLIELLKSVTGFSLGHSITLGLSAFKIIHIHSIWVEVAIAFSIAYSAGTSLFRPQTRHRWVLAALFGTVHGLGFASALQELQLSTSETWRALIGFNVGIEFGQLVIVALIAPMLFLFGKRSPRAFKWIHRLGTSLLLIVGALWFLLRFTAAMAPP